MDDGERESQLGLEIGRTIPAGSDRWRCFGRREELRIRSRVAGYRRGLMRGCSWLGMVTGSLGRGVVLVVVFTLVKFLRGLSRRGAWRERRQSLLLFLLALA